MVLKCSDQKMLEMSVAAFLGFGPYAWEYFVMYNFTKLLLRWDVENKWLAFSFA